MSPPPFSVISASTVEGAPTAIKRLSGTAVRRSVLRILRENVLCSMATITADNRAHINTAYFCYSDDLELYFLLHPNSRHCRNLTTNPSMAITIFSSLQQWHGPDRGLQLFGTCGVASAARARNAESLYGKRFAEYATWKKNLRSGDAARSYRFYHFVVRSLKLLDEKTFGDGVFLSVAIR